MNNFVKKILNARGYNSEEAIDEFLNPQPHDRKLMKNITEVSDKIKEYIDKKITIFGDYDCDGISSSTILYKTLKNMKWGSLQVYTPERKEGYSLSKKAIDGFEDTDLLITVDCGISSHEEIKYAQSKGIEVIVIDHHEGQEPPCLYVDPKVGNEYPFRDLAGVGVTYKVCQELLNSELKSLIDYVAFATIADVMPLVDENRWIVQEGLKRLNNYPSEPFKKMIRELKSKEITAGYVGYVLAPIINAGGRMDNAKLASKYMLHEYEYSFQAEEDLKTLIEYNQQRKAVEKNTAKQIEFDKDKNIVIADMPMPRGIVGLVAGRLKEQEDKPAIVIDTKTLKGSCRSIKPLNMVETLSKVEDLLKGYGGHKMASGFQIKEGKLEEFKQRMYELTEGIEYELIKYDDELSPYGFTKYDVKALDELQPFGVGNPKPKFKIDNIRPYDIRILKDEHLSFKIGSNVKCIGFNLADKSDDLVDGSSIIGQLDINHYAGNEYLQVIVKRIIKGE